MFGEVKGEKIKSAISNKLYQTFKIEDVNKPSTFICDTIYKDKTPQLVVRPAFFIHILDVQLEKRMFNQFDKMYNLVVRYELAEYDIQNYHKLNEIGAQLFTALKQIELEIPAFYLDEHQKKHKATLPIRGTRMEYTIQDNILHFFVTYKLRVFEDIEKEPEMKEVKTNVTKKEDEK